MAVTQYDGHKAFLQDTLAKFGEDRAHLWANLSNEQDKSGVMSEKRREVNEAALSKLSKRDKERSKTDPNFKPQDTDFNAVRSLNYNPTVDYYAVLGVEEYATQDEVKKAYKKMSLIYHPDKLSGATQEEKDEAAAVFIELKSAYKLLADQPTRRQYDFERDKATARTELRGKPAPEMEIPFSAIEALMKRAERKNTRIPSKTKEIKIKCKLEKFVYGGHKAVTRTRQVKELGSYPVEFTTEDRVYRIDLPQGAVPPFPVEFVRQGDQHQDQEPDTLKFLVSPKPNEEVDLKGVDLHLKSQVDLGRGWRSKPYMAIPDVASVRGRHALLWGRNPFLGSNGASEIGRLHIRLRGEGLGEAGSLCLVARMGLGLSSSSSSFRRPQPTDGQASGVPECKHFLERFELGPNWGFRRQEIEEQNVAEAPAMRRRMDRKATFWNADCDVELQPLGTATGLHTRPPCNITFYSNARPSSDARLAPYTMFAISISSPSCAPRKDANKWAQLRGKLVPLLERTGFYLLRIARGILPRPITLNAPFIETALDANTAEKMPWKRIGAEAYALGDFWYASMCYTKQLEELPEEGEDTAKALSNRAACLTKRKDLEGALEDARKATQLAPKWSRAWSRLGLAAGMLGGDVAQEGFDAHVKAVELDPSNANVEALLAATKRFYTKPEVDEAHVVKEKGNEAMRMRELGLAIAMYTVGLAHLPERVPEPAVDEHAMLRAVLLTNRSTVFTWMRRWDAAREDAKEAVALAPEFTKAHCRLGTALLALGLHEQAYAEFAAAAQLDGENYAAQRGSKGCLVELQCWRSAAAQRRWARFMLDAGRHATRVFAISDVHFAQKRNMDWVHSIDSSAFQGDVLIVAGNLGDTKGMIMKGLATLKSKFHRVFYTVGNHEMGIHRSEQNKFPDSMAKLYSILESCDEAGIDVFPAHVCYNVYVLPLFSWYDASFDEKDPFPNPNLHYDSTCKWPMDADEQLWKYMLRLNEPMIKIPYQGTRITFSCFLPRKTLPYDKNAFGLAKVIGCEVLDEQIRAAGSRLHVFGRSGKKYSQIHSNVRYVQAPLGKEKDRKEEDVPPFMLVHNGRHICMQEWGIDGQMQTRIVHIVFYGMPKINENPRQRGELTTIKNKLNDKVSGMTVSFYGLGSRKLDKDELVEKVLPELGPLSCGATHGLVAVADDVKALKSFLHGDLYKKDWASVAKPYITAEASFTLPLGLNLLPEDKLNDLPKDDPLLVVYAMALRPVSEDSEEYGKLLTALAAINNLPGAAGRIAASFQSLGFNGLNHQEFLRELNAEDKSAGCTHCFIAAVDSNDSLKLLRQSKTFGRWKTAYESLLEPRPAGIPNQFCFVVPLMVTATTDAPRLTRQQADK